MNHFLEVWKLVIMPESIATRQRIRSYLGNGALKCKARVFATPPAASQKQRLVVEHSIGKNSAFPSHAYDTSTSHTYLLGVSYTYTSLISHFSSFTA